MGTEKAILTSYIKSKAGSSIFGSYKHVHFPYYTCCVG